MDAYKKWLWENHKVTWEQELDRVMHEVYEGTDFDNIVHVNYALVKSILMTPAPGAGGRSKALTPPKTGNQSFTLVKESAEGDYGVYK